MGRDAGAQVLSILKVPRECLQTAETGPTPGQRVGTLPGWALGICPLNTVPCFSMDECMVGKSPTTAFREDEGLTRGRSESQWTLGWRWDLGGRNVWREGGIKLFISGALSLRWPLDVQASLSGWPLETRVGTGGLEVQRGSRELRWLAPEAVGVDVLMGGRPRASEICRSSSKDRAQQGRREARPGRGQGWGGRQDRRASRSAWEKLRVGLEGGGHRDCERSRLNGQEQPRPEGLVKGARRRRHARRQSCPRTTCSDWEQRNGRAFCLFWSFPKSYGGTFVCPGATQRLGKPGGAGTSEWQSRGT